MSTRAGILQLLADGALHSGADIGGRLGITRAAVSKSVRALRAQGLRLEVLPGRGYRLEAPLTPLAPERIAAELHELAPAARVVLIERVDSTNRHLLARALAPGDPSAMVCLTEVQHRGRGRRGRAWVATPYENLMLSMAWRFAAGPALASGLSLAAGVAVARALERYGVRGAGIKWPNDILWDERKLAGLLADVHGEASGPCTVVLGVGINCRIAPADAARIDQPWVDLATITAHTVDRNRLAALLITELHAMFTAFAAGGLAPFCEDWERRHLYAWRAVRLARDGACFEGTVEGIDESGALRVRGREGEMRKFYSGDMSLRPRA